MDNLRGSGKALLLVMGFLTATWTAAVLAGTPGATQVGARGSGSGTGAYGESDLPPGLDFLPGVNEILFGDGEVREPDVTAAAFEVAEVPSDPSAQIAFGAPAPEAARPSTGGSGSDGSLGGSSPSTTKPSQPAPSPTSPPPPPTTSAPALWEQKAELERQMREAKAELETQARQARLELEAEARQARLEAERRARELQAEAQRRARELQLQLQRLNQSNTGTSGGATG